MPTEFGASAPRPFGALARSLRSNRFLRFIATGGVSAVVDVSLLAALVWAGAERQVGVSIGFVAGLAVNFLMHKYFTFSSRQAIEPREVFAYLSVAGLNYLLTMLIIEGLVRRFGAPLVLAKGCSLPLVAVVGFLLSRRLVFPGPRQER